MTFTCQPALRPALPCVYGPLDYREQRALFERIDTVLSASGLEEQFIKLTLAERKTDACRITAKRLERFAKYSVLALRTNIARTLTGLDHRDFAIRLADSPLLQWFLRVGEMGSIKAFPKSTSDRLSRWASEETVRDINEKLTALLAATTPQDGETETPLKPGETAARACLPRSLQGGSGQRQRFRRALSQGACRLHSSQSRTGRPCGR